MKTQHFKTGLFTLSIMLSVLCGFSQIQIDSTVNPEQMVEKLTGPGILAVDNITFQGVNQARGFFSNADSTNLGMDNGIFLCTGSGENIPGPNTLSNAGTGNWIGGHATLNGITIGTTYDASMLEFDFIPINDTLQCWYVFGSEEYNEHVFTNINDVFGFFLTGPNPMGGFYANRNIAIVPGTTNTNVSINNVNNGNWPPGTIPSGPCTNCQYFSDNTNGLSLEYDGFTTVLYGWCLVVPYETYHIKIGIADVNGYGYDSGLFIEEQGLFFLGPAELTSYQFLMENNPGLSFDIAGGVIGNDIFVEVPYGTDVTNLVASYEDLGAFVYVNDVLQTSGETSNDFTDPVIYHLEGHGIADYTVYVDIVSDIQERLEPIVIVFPNPAKNKVYFEFEVQSSRFEVEFSITNMLGKEIMRKTETVNNSSSIYWDSKHLPDGIYYYTFNVDGFQKSGKIVIQN